MSRLTFQGCPLDAVSLTFILDRAKASFMGFDPLIIEGLNVFKLIQARKDRSLMESLEEAGLVHIDGAGISVGARILGYKLPPRRAGIDLMADLLTLASQIGSSVFLLGATQETIEKAAANISTQWPQLKIAGLRNGYFTNEDAPAVAEEISLRNADLLLVGMSSPKKELFLKNHMADCRVRVAMGVGGSFDVYAGHIPRAPIWMQKSGLEWFFRLINEPRRLWWRYLSTNAIFVFLLLSSLIKRQSR